MYYSLDFDETVTSFVVKPFVSLVYKGHKKYAIKSCEQWHLKYLDGKSLFSSKFQK